MFINVKSEYSILQSTIFLNKYIEYAKINNLNTLCLCDTNSTFGIFKFIKSCIENNINPIVGLELDLGNQRLIFIAKNSYGIQDLFKLNTLYNKKEALKLKNYDNLILIIGPGAISSQLTYQNFNIFNKLREKFKNLYIGIEENTSKTFLGKIYEMAQNLNIKILDITAKKCFFCKDIEALATLQAIENNQKIKNCNLQKFKFNSFETKNDKFNNLEILNEEIFYNLDLFKADKPKYPFLKDITDIDELKRLAYAGLKKRLKNQISNVYLQRLAKELKVIENLGFASYFLIVLDIIKFAKKENIYVGPSRGSVGGCLVAYCLGITNIDPIQYNLLFERFLNSERITMPDIDLDFEDRYRDKIIDYVIKRYGVSNVCQIGTINRFLIKSAIREVCRVWDIEDENIQYIIDSINPKYNFSENLENDIDFQLLFETNESLKKIKNIILTIEGLPRQRSIHAAGIIISHCPMTKYCSLTIDNVSELEAKELEELGLLKLDILALSNLTFIHKIINRIKINNKNFDLNKIPMDDLKTYKLLCSGDVIGIFQMDSRGMRNALLQIQPKNIDEIALTLSLYRPGPKEYIKYYHKLKQSFVVKNKVDEILKDTAGIIVYQEQIMLIAMIVANYDLNKADILRRGISKRNPELVHNMRQDFIKRAINNGYNKDYATKLFEKIEKFAYYGFNKAHAYGYAMIVYQMAYLKANYMNIFYAHLYTYTINSDKKYDFINELTRNKIILKTPDLFSSAIDVVVDNNALRLGFANINNIGIDIAKKMVDLRQVININDDIINIIEKFLKPLCLTKKQVYNLIFAGVFDCFKTNKATLIANIDKFYEEKNLKIFKYGGEVAYEKRAEYDELYLEQKEKEALNINIKYNLFDKYLKIAQNQLNMKIYKIDQLNNISGVFNCIIKVETIKKIFTKKNKKMAFIECSSIKNYTLILFPSNYQELIEKFRENQYYILNLQKKDNDLIIKNIIKEL